MRGAQLSLPTRYIKTSPWANRPTPPLINTKTNQTPSSPSPSHLLPHHPSLPLLQSRHFFPLPPSLSPFRSLSPSTPFHTPTTTLPSMQRWRGLQRGAQRGEQRRQYTKEAKEGKEEERGERRSAGERRKEMIELLSEIRKQQFFNDLEEGIFTSRELSPELFEKRNQLQSELSSLIRSSILHLHEATFLSHILLPVVSHFQGDFSLIGKALSLAEINANCLSNFINEIYFTHHMSMQVVSQTIAMCTAGWSYSEFADVIAAFISRYLSLFPHPIPLQLLSHSSPDDDPFLHHHFDISLFAIPSDQLDITLHFNNNNNNNVKKERKVMDAYGWGKMVAKAIPKGSPGALLRDSILSLTLQGPLLQVVSLEHLRSLQSLRFDLPLPHNTPPLSEEDKAMKVVDLENHIAILCGVCANWEFASRIEHIGLICRDLSFHSSSFCSNYNGKWFTQQEMTNFVADFISSMAIAIGEKSNRSYVDRLLGMCTDSWNGEMIEQIAPRISERVVFPNPIVAFFQNRFFTSSKPHRLF